MDADMYWSGLGKVSASKGCIVEDRGALRHASRSGGAYIFSDTEVGALPLVLLGPNAALSGIQSVMEVSHERPERAAD